MNETQKISFPAAVLMSMNIMIGAGIFFGPQIMAGYAGSLSFLGWPIVAIFLSPIIINVATAARLFPGDGGFYTYCKSMLGETGGFIALWSFFMGYLGAAGVQIIVTREAFVQSFGWEWAANYPILFNLSAILLLALLNLLSVALISKVQSSFTLVKLLPLFFVIGLLVFYYNPAITYATSNILALGLTVPVGIFAYNGWESCCTIGHLIEGGSQRVPAVIFTAFAIVVALYTLFHLSIIQIMGVDNLLAQGASAFPLFLGVSEGTIFFIKTAIAYAFLISYINALYGVSMANITTMQGLVEKNIIPGGAFLSGLNSNFRPAKVIALYALIFLAVVTAVPSKIILVGFTGLGMVVTFMLTITSVAARFIQDKEYSKLFLTAFGYIACATLFYFSFLSIGATLSERLFNALPVGIGYIIGFVLYNFNKK